MKPRRPPQRITKIGAAPMSGEACEIAVSELTGTPLDELCGWVVIGLRHQGGDKHMPVIVPSDVEFYERHLAGLLEQVAANVRLTLDGEKQ